MLSKSKASPYNITLLRSFILSDEVSKIGKDKLKMCIVHSYPSGYAPYTERYPNFWNQGIINPLPSKLEEVYGRFLLTKK